MKKLQIWPVIHVDEYNHSKAFSNAEMAASSGCDGVFVISMDGFDDPLCKIGSDIKKHFPSLLIGVNHLQSNCLHSLIMSLDAGLDATWTDRTEVNSDSIGGNAHSVADILKLNPSHQFFGSVAFKYQKTEHNPAQAVKNAFSLGMIPTTSGPATGKAAKIEKLREIREQIGNIPLAIASGVTPENINEQAPFLTHILVATGISFDEYTFSKEKLSMLFEEVGKIS